MLHESFDERPPSTTQSIDESPATKEEKALLTQFTIIYNAPDILFVCDRLAGRFQPRRSLGVGGFDTDRVASKSTFFRSDSTRGQGAAVGIVDSPA